MIIVGVKEGNQYLSWDTDQEKYSCFLIVWSAIGLLVERGITELKPMDKVTWEVKPLSN